MKIHGIIKNDFKQINGVIYINEPNGKFEDIYFKLREAEGRIYTDTELKLLPHIPKSHKYYNEWQIRKKSSESLIDSIGRNQKSIMDLGCGNGWLTNNLAMLNNDVIGVDLNIRELEQASRVFGGKENITFVYGNVFDLNLKFDYIILAGVIAYFHDLNKLIIKLISCLNQNGEIHIIDSPFYKNLAAPEQNSFEYFTNLGFEEMSKYYHHHSLNELQNFNYHILYNPNKFLNKIKRKIGFNMLPFHWIKITT